MTSRHLGSLHRTVVSSTSMEHEPLRVNSWSRSQRFPPETLHVRVASKPPPRNPFARLFFTIGTKPSSTLFPRDFSMLISNQTDTSEPIICRRRRASQTEKDHSTSRAGRISIGTNHMKSQSVQGRSSSLVNGAGADAIRLIEDRLQRRLQSKISTGQCS